MRVVSRLSASVNGGRMVGRRAASIDLPVPGEPIISTLCPPGILTLLLPLSGRVEVPDREHQHCNGWSKNDQQGEMPVRSSLLESWIPFLSSGLGAHCSSPWTQLLVTSARCARSASPGPLTAATVPRPQGRAYCT